MYALLRAMAGFALRWYYSDIQVASLERLPRHRPLLLVVNHPNALVDALLVGWIVPRRVFMTAKATLFRNRVASVLLKWLGVLPLRRLSDEQTSGGGVPDATRNAATFAAVQAVLARGGCILIFPEGKTPDEPALAPLKTGAARMALHARDSGEVPGLAIVPIGLVFERKEAPRSRVFAQIGEPILIDDWGSPLGSKTAEALTAEIAARLRALTLSYDGADEAARAIRLATLVAALVEDTPAVGTVHRGFATETAIARRIDEIRRRLANADEHLRSRADELVRRVETAQRTASAHGLALEDVRIDLRAGPGARFVLREGAHLVASAPAGLWGWLNHWLPLRAARLVATRNTTSAADPAMRTIIAGTAFVILTYAVQAAAVATFAGKIVATIYVVSLPIAADINFALRDRTRLALMRARAYLTLRRNPALASELGAMLADLRVALVAFDQAISEMAPSNEDRPTFVRTDTISR